MLGFSAITELPLAAIPEQAQIVFVPGPPPVVETQNVAANTTRRVTVVGY